MAIINYHCAKGRLLGEDNNGTRTDYMTDALGSVTGTVNSSQAVVNTYRYKPFGELLAKTGSGADPKFMWNGGTQSRRTGLAYSDQYNRARHYGTRQGQWTTVDPLWPGEGAYGYARQSPASRRDPYGLSSCGHERTSDCAPPILLPVPCCRPKIECLTAAQPDSLVSMAYFNMDLGDEAPASVARGGLSVVFAYRISWKKESPGVVCPTPTIHVGSIWAAATSGQRRNQVFGDWCKEGHSPIPPSSAVSPSYRLSTGCHDGDGPAFVIGSERFKFRIGDRTLNRSVTCGSNTATRSGFLVHPDGGASGTGGCIGLLDESGSKRVRSCLSILNEAGCGQIPLEVIYRHV